MMIDKNQQPLISFIIPVLNEAADIAATLKPLKDLNWANKEIIVADGGSTDNTVAIAQNLADQVYVRPQGEKNKSIAENRNKGAGLAVGKYLFYLDCGVKIYRLKEFIKEVIKQMAAGHKLVGITSEIRFYPAEESEIDRLHLWVINKSIKGLNKVKVGAGMGWVQVVRREAFEKIGGYNEELTNQEDADLFRRLNKVGRTKVLKNFVAYGSAERYHQDGWAKVNGRWLVNWLSYILRGKSYSKEWKPVKKMEN